MRRPTLCRHRRRRLRSGATLVETALVLSLLLLFLFGIFEYARYLLVHQLLANAARDGVRYASVNVDKSNAFVTTAEGGVIDLHLHHIGVHRRDVATDAAVVEVDRFAVAAPLDVEGSVLGGERLPRAADAPEQRSKVVP